MPSSLAQEGGREPVTGGAPSPRHPSRKPEGSIDGRRYDRFADSKISRSAALGRKPPFQTLLASTRTFVL